MGTNAGARAAVALVLLALSGAGGLAAPVPDEAALRKRALQLNEITGSGPMKGQLKALLADQVGTKKLLELAARMAKEKPQPFNRNATLLLALAADGDKDLDTAAFFFRLNAGQERALLSENGLAQAYTGLIQLYFDARRYTDGEKVCREFLDLEGEEDGSLESFKPVVLRRLILAVAKNGSIEKALAMADKEIKSHPENWLYRIAKAQVLREADKLDDAAKVYADVIERVKKDKRLEKPEREDYVDEYRYILSGLYVDLDQVGKAAEQLKALLAKEPNNPTYNNDLGFIWADKGMNLPKAEKLIRKAIEEERKLKKKLKLDEKANSSYVDSLGWVLFKQGKAKEAKPYLLQAVKDKEGQHVEIYDHLGDIHMALGERAEALAAWKKGVSLAGKGKREQKRKAEVLKKLKKQD